MECKSRVDSGLSALRQSGHSIKVMTKDDFKELEATESNSPVKKDYSQWDVDKMREQARSRVREQRMEDKRVAMSQSSPKMEQQAAVRNRQEKRLQEKKAKERFRREVYAINALMRAFTAQKMEAYHQQKLNEKQQQQQQQSVEGVGCETAD